MSAQLNFTVENQIITRTDDFQPVAKSQNYLRASFTFSDDWGDDDKIAIFKTGGKSYEVILDANGECVVPWEVLTRVGNVYVSAYSGDRVTASVAKVPVLKTGYVDDPTSTEDPSVDIYQQLKAQIQDLQDEIPEIDDTAGAGDTDKTWSADKITSELANAGSVQDVTVNGTSVVGQDGVAEIPVADASALGVVKSEADGGVYVDTDGSIKISIPSTAVIKAGTNTKKPIVPYHQHSATFYGLAKASGDTTQSASSNPVGTYTDNAKASIKAMLGVGGETQKVAVSGTAPVIVANQNTRYVCGEVVSLDFTPSAEGICDVIFTSGSTVTVLTLPSTVRMPEWWEGPEAGYTYEINVVDGIYGVVTSWAV